MAERKLRQPIKKLLAYITMAGIVAALISGTKISAYAEEAEKQTSGMKLGTGNIGNPVYRDTNLILWVGSYVYYGSYNEEPIKFRVLCTDLTEYGENTMLLDCNSVLWTGEEPLSYFDAMSNDWNSSYIKKYLNSEGEYAETGFLTTAFSKAEQGAIAYSTKEEPSELDGWGWSELQYVPLVNTKIFLLDAKEVTRPSFGYNNGDTTSESRIKGGGHSSWWLRSKSCYTANTEGISFVNGYLYERNVNYTDIGVSPALNIKLSSILFCAPVDSDAWKLTVIDESQNISVRGNGDVYKKENVITIPYTYDGEGATQLSLLITDKEYTDADASIIHYEKITGQVDGTGVVSFEIPADFDQSWKVYVFAEQVNEGKYTDWATKPLEINIPAEDVEYIESVENDETDSTNDTDVTETQDNTITTDNAEEDNSTGEDSGSIVPVIVLLAVIAVCVALVIVKKKKDSSGKKVG